MKIYDKEKNIFKMYRNTEDTEIDYDSVRKILKNDKQAVLVDVRSNQEYKEYHLEGSINLPFYDLKSDCEKELKDKNATIILYCQTGIRSKKALKILENKGYQNLYEIKGGLE